jgi:hypothetical protein
MTEQETFSPLARLGSINGKKVLLNKMERLTHITGTQGRSRNYMLLLALLSLLEKGNGKRAR